MIYTDVTKKTIELADTCLYPSNLFPRRTTTMIINHNIAALTAYRNMTIAGNMVTRAIEKLSSGLRSTCGSNCNG
ncbi:hypothetical protein Desgi_2272 [Desulfoscipio gibsoniae DSM 7213]|uniref:Uncharacterized protein n=1 Tax=Desulfoscipio gibsoniae DSM 7213 TaxID=767817 RepID=R4KMD6_9FIRM|nr:hypothetical protein Desgi_2272 [Desulfoscipio gibsoniae DSM 7213]